MRQEGVNALDWIEELVTKEKLDCNFLELVVSMLLILENTMMI